jgi:hypothetical protein
MDGSLSRCGIGIGVIFFDLNMPIQPVQVIFASAINMPLIFRISP